MVFPFLQECSRPSTRLFNCCPSNKPWESLLGRIVLRSLWWSTFVRQVLYVVSDVPPASSVRLPCNLVRWYLSWMHWHRQSVRCQRVSSFARLPSAQVRVSVIATPLGCIAFSRESSKNGSVSCWYVAETRKRDEGSQFITGAAVPVNAWPLIYTGCQGDRNAEASDRSKKVEYLRLA